MSIGTLNRLIVASLTVSLLTLSISHAAEPWHFNPDSLLARHIQEALANNPKLQSQRSGADASETRISQAGAWPDPMVSLGLMNLPVNSFTLNQEPMTGLWVNLNQTIPLNGGNGIKSEIAEQQYLISELAVQNSELQIIRDLSISWFTWSYLLESARTLAETELLLDDLTQIALRRYETGQGNQADVLRLQTDRAVLQDQRMLIEQQASAAGRKAATLMGRSPDDSPAPPALLSSSFDPLDEAATQQAITEQNPGYQAVKTSAEVSALNLKLQKREWWPDLKLGVGYGFRQDAANGMERPDFFSVSAGFSLPLFGSAKQGKAVQEARLMQQKTASDIREIELQLRLQLEVFTDEDQRLSRQIELFDAGILPQAEAAFNATLAAYSVGSSTIDALISTEKTVLKSQLDRYARVRDRWKVRTDIAVLTGTGIPHYNLNLTTD
ncbi:TolC family protein, partial [bacterium]|nr:TolC family protein [bacterium]